MSWVKVGRWVLQMEDIVALEHRADGTGVKLRGGHEARLNKAEAAALLHRFQKDLALEDLGVEHDL